jgi:hypothetical protein
VLCWSGDVHPAQPTALSYREPSLGQVFARSDWSDDATWMSFNAGPHLDTHQHYDAGNLTIYRHADLIVDSGSFDNFGTTHWYNYYVRTVAHNTITVTDPSERWFGIWGGVQERLTVNDGGQRTAAPLTPAPTLDEYLGNRDAYDQATIARYDEGPWGVYSLADLTNAYQNPAFQSARPNGVKNQPKVSHVQRELVYLRRDGARRDAFVVFDRVVATDPSFKKAVLWHARQPFETSIRGTSIDEGETRYAGLDRYDFQTRAVFDEGSRPGRARLFVTVLAIDPISVRQIGKRVPTAAADHVTFSVEHHHRHVKDYFVEDPRRILNPNRTLGAFGRTEWPPFNPPEQQWLWTDDLVGGWGQTRLQIEPSAPRMADRFLTVLVPADDNEVKAPTVSGARSADGSAAAAVVEDGAFTSVVIFGADPNGSPLMRASVDVPVNTRNGELTIASLAPGARYTVGAANAGDLRRFGVAHTLTGSVAADAAGVIRLSFDAIPRVNLGAGLMGEGGLGTASIGSVLGEEAGTALAVQGSPASGGQANAVGRKGRHPGLVTVNATAAPDLDQWDARVAGMLSAGELRVRETVADTLVPGRMHQRLAQLYKGVPVFGGEVARQVENRKTVSVFGTLYQDIALNPVPKLTTGEAADLFQKLAGASLGPSRTPELIILPMDDDGSYRLTYRSRIATADDVMMYFIDANTGETVLTFSDLRRPVL